MSMALQIEEIQGVMEVAIERKESRVGAGSRRGIARVIGKGNLVEPETAKDDLDKVLLCDQKS